MAVNLFVASGNLTRDAECRFTQAGKQLAYFTVAVNTGKNEDPLFVRVTVWEKLAEQCQALKKATAVLVQGRLRMGKWKGDDGKERQQLELTGSTVEFLDRGARAGATTGATELEQESDPF